MKAFSFIHKVNNPQKITKESVVTFDQKFKWVWTSSFNPREDRDINERNSIKIKKNEGMLNNHSK